MKKTFMHGTISFYLYMLDKIWKSTRPRNFFFP